MQNAYPLQFALRVLWVKRSEISEGRRGGTGRGATGASGMSPEAVQQAFAFATSGHLCSGDDS